MALWPFSWAMKMATNKGQFGPIKRRHVQGMLDQTDPLKEGKFSGAGCQNMSKEEILLQRVII